MKTPKLAFEREPIHIYGATAERLDLMNVEVAVENRLSMPMAGRDSIAATAGRIGLVAFREGRHVALHATKHGDRLAIITGNFGDWL